MVDFDLDGAGVDLVALVEFIEFARGAQPLDGDRRDIHQADGFRPVEFLPQSDIFVVGFLQQGICELDAVDHGQKRGVAAVIRPVGVDHPDLGERRVAPLGEEIVLAERRVVGVHRKTVFLDERFQPLAVELGEAGKRRDVGRHVVFRRKGRGQIERRFARLDRVDDVLFDLIDGVFVECAVEQIDLRRPDQRAHALRDDLDALRGGVRPLVELTGEVLDCKRHGGVGRQLVGDGIELRLGEDRPLGVLEQFLGQPLRVVAVEDPHAGKRGDPEQVVRLVKQRLRFRGKPRFLFNVASVNHSQFFFAASALAPTSFL